MNKYEVVDRQTGAMHVIDGKEVSTATWLASEREFEATGHTSYIRPVYRNDAFIGFAVYVGGEAVGRVFAEYKQAALLLMQIRAEQCDCGPIADNE